jgi:hypothetical protein
MKKTFCWMDNDTKADELRAGDLLNAARIAKKFLCRNKSFLTCIQQINMLTMIL